MSVWTPQQEQNRLHVALRLVGETVDNITQDADLKSMYEESLMDLFNKIGASYGWKVCPAESSQLPLILHS